MPASVGRASVFGVAKLKALVRSPHTARRNGEMLGSFTPKRVSRKRSTEVWSKACELTQPPRLQGEITYSGTRGPGPNTRLSGFGCEVLPSGAGCVKYSGFRASAASVVLPAGVLSGLSEGAEGEGMWSK
ncbi:hypothetical protein D3C71_1249730 [compost metagenome]